MIMWMMTIDCTNGTPSTVSGSPRNAGLSMEDAATMLRARSFRRLPCLSVVESITTPALAIEGITHLRLCSRTCAALAAQR